MSINIMRDIDSSVVGDSFLSHTGVLVENVYNTVDSVSERMNIPTDRLVKGMVVIQRNDNTVWEWDGSYWVMLNR